MYNRYIPSANGVYERQCISDMNESCGAINTSIPIVQLEQPTPAAKSEGTPQKAVSSGFDLGDLLLLCIIVLLMLDSDQDDLSTILITAAAFLFLQ